MRPYNLAAFAVATVLNSASSCAPAWGGQGETCYPNGTCNAGLTCSMNKCVPGGAGGGACDTGGDGGTGGGMGGGMGGGGAGGGIGGLSGLVLWLDAAKGVSGTTSITAWADQSSAHNDVSATAGASLSPGAVNGLPAVSLSSTTLEAMNNASFGFGADELFAEAVVRVNATHSLIFGTNAMRLQSAITGGFAEVQLGPSTFVTSSTTLIDNPTPLFHLVGVHRTGSGANATVEVRVGGAVAASQTGAPYAYDLGPSAPGLIGGNDTIEDIAEVVVIKGSISMSDLATVEGALKTKYGL
jgi:hypothetical protein